MGSLRAWRVNDGVAQPMTRSAAFLERDLEDWIFHDPTLVMDGVSWVGRQVVLSDGSRLDLLGLTPQDQWVIAELKQGPVGVGTLAQALHYTMIIGALEANALLERCNQIDDTKRDELSQVHTAVDPSARELSILLVGTGHTPEMHPAVGFFETHGLDVPIRVVTFTPFKDAAGAVTLVREVDDAGGPDGDGTSRAVATVDKVRAQAVEEGVESAFEEGIAVAERLGLRVKPWGRSITIVPPFTRGRTLIYLSPRNGQMHIGYSESNLEDLYSIPEAAVLQALGTNWRDESVDGTLMFLAAFRELFKGALTRNADLDEPPQE